MPKRVGEVTKDILVAAALPQATKTYTVISHEFVINAVLKVLNEKGFVVVKEKYTCNEGGNVATGLYHINYGNDPELGMLFAFSNSYDKSLRFRCAIGGFVKLNDMSVLGDTSSSWGRKHTGTADDETLATIENQIDNAEGYFKQLKADKEVMKKIKLTGRQFAELIGRLYIDLKIINGEQIRIIKREFEKPSFRYTTEALSLWTLYNHILVALSKCHPRTWMEQQKIVHLHMMTEYQLSMFDDEPAIIKNPNQLDLVEEAERLSTVDNPEIPSQEEINAGTYGESMEENQITLADLDEDTEKSTKPFTQVIEDFNDVVTNIPMDEEPLPEEEDGELNKEIHLTEDELSEQLHGVNNNEESITMTSSTLDEQEPMILGADSPEEEAEIRQALANEGLAKSIPAEESKSILPTATGKSWQRPTPVESKVEEEPVEDPKPFVSREEGAELRADKRVSESNAPKPTMTIENAIKEFGDCLTEEQLSDLNKGIMNPEAIAIFKAEYLKKAEIEAIHRKASEELTEAVTEDVVEAMKEDFVTDTILSPAPTEDIVNTPEVEKVEESIVEEAVETTIEEVDSAEEFFMSKQDLNEMYPGTELEVGSVVTLMDQHFEITTIDPAYDYYGLTAIALSETEEVVEEVVEEIAPTIEIEQNELSDLDPQHNEEQENFEIGDPEAGLPTENMLRTKSVKEDLALTPADNSEQKADEAIAVMEAKSEANQQDDAITNAIMKEIEELYGAEIPFTYELSGTQYNVTLDTGEVLVLTADYINTLK